MIEATCTCTSIIVVRTCTHVMGCLNLLVINYKELRGKEHVVSGLAVSRIIVESALSVRIRPSLVVLDGRRKDA